VLLSGFVLAHLGIVQVEGADTTYHEGLYIGLVSALGDLVGLIGNVELGTLVVELLHQDEKVLVEVHGLFLEAALYHFPVALGYLHLTTAFAPVEQWDAEAYFHYLIVLQRVVGTTESLVGAGETHLGEEIDLTEVAFSLGHFIVGFQLATTDVVGKGIVGQCLVQGILIVHQHGWKGVRKDRFQFFILSQGQERAELEHVALQGTFVVGQSRLGIQYIQLQLEHIVLADLSHLSLGLRHFVQLLGILQVLLGDAYILFGQQKVEEIVDGGHGHFFGLAQEVGLGFGVAHRFDAAVPLEGVHPEDGLVQGQGDRYGHVSFVLGAIELLHEIERGVQRERTSREPDVLVDGEFAGHLHEVVADEGIRTVALLVTVVALGIAGDSGREVHFRQKVGSEGAVFPISGFQLVQCHGGIYALYSCQSDGIIECDGAGADSCFRHRAKAAS